MKNKYALALVTGVVLLITTMILGMLFDLIFPTLKAEYETSVFRPWSDPLMTLFYIYPIVLGILLTYLWFKSRKSWKSGIDFGVTMGLLMAIPSFIVNYSSFTFSFLMVGSWVLFGFVNVLVAGLTLEKLEG